MEVKDQGHSTLSLW